MKNSDCIKMEGNKKEMNKKKYESKQKSKKISIEKGDNFFLYLIVYWNYNLEKKKERKEVENGTRNSKMEQGRNRRKKKKSRNWSLPSTAPFLPTLAPFHCHTYIFLLYNIYFI